MCRALAPHGTACVHTKSLASSELNGEIIVDTAKFAHIAQFLLMLEVATNNFFTTREHTPAHTQTHRLLLVCQATNTHGASRGVTVKIYNTTM